MLHDLQEQALRCREVVGTMLRVAELEVDPQDAPVVDMQGVLRQVAELVAGAFRKRGIGLTLTPAQADRLMVRVDPSQCARLITQVLAGMRAGLDSGAHVTVAARQRGDQVIVQLDASQPVAERVERRDDWMASGHTLWVARQLVASLGGALHEHDDGRSFELAFPGG
jgi:signal transduction histidine kinase